MRLLLPSHVAHVWSIYVDFVVVGASAADGEVNVAVVHSRTKLIQAPTLGDEGRILLCFNAKAHGVAFSSTSRPG
jgi:hypothetical protein